MNPQPAARGHCNCGAVSFAIAQPIADIYVCHCSLCRRATGTMGVAVVVVPNAALVWQSGEDLIQRWLMPGHDWECRFCRVCGSPLPGRNSDDTSYVPVGLLSEGAEGLQVKHHIWVSSKAPWHCIGDAGKQHPEGFVAED